jgi:Ca2+-dependent lipid-binding protein
MDLHVGIVEARKLPNMDVVGKTDAYCSLYVRPDSKLSKTKVIANNLEPVWNETFQFPVTSFASDVFFLQMFDGDVVNDDEMGTLTIKVVDIPTGEIVDAWIALEGVSGCQKPGELHIRFHLLLRGSTPWEPSPFVPNKLILTVFAAKDLAKMDTFGTSDPYVVLDLKGQGNPQKTTVKKKRLTPAWNESFEFILTSPTTDVLTLVMWDKDMLKDDQMASREFPVTQFVTQDAPDAWYDLKPVQGIKKGDRFGWAFELCRCCETRRDTRFCRNTRARWS